MLVLEKKRAIKRAAHILIARRRPPALQKQNKKTCAREKWPLGSCARIFQSFVDEKQMRKMMSARCFECFPIVISREQLDYEHRVD